MNRMFATVLAALGALLPAAAFATNANPVPEPELWALLAVAGVAAAVITIRNRRK